jgi:hypothetical protein
MESVNIEEKKYEKEKPSKKKSHKYYCANCKYCVLIRVPSSKDGMYLLRVRCNKGKWKKKLGDEKLYKYFSVNRRVSHDCEYYEDMGELKQYLKDLKKTLPQSDEKYKYSSL